MRALHLIRLLLPAAGLAAFAAPALAQGPSLLVPPRADSVTMAPPAPLLIPGANTTRPDTSVDARLRRAIEQYQLGRTLETQNQPGSAVMAYNNALQLNPRLPDAHFRMAELFVARERWREAAHEYAAELANNPTHPLAERGMGVALANVGDTTRAIQHLESLVRRRPDDAENWQAMSYAYTAAGRPEQAERALREALRRAPKDGDAWRDLGVVLAQRQKLGEARDAYRRAASLLPRDGAVWVNLGNLEVRAARIDSALADYREAESRDSLLAFAYAGQVRALEVLGRDREAAEVRRRWVRRFPDDDDVRVDAIQAWAKLGRNDVSVEIAREGVRNRPRSASARAALGIALTSDGQWEAGLAELRRAESLYRKPEQQKGIRDYVASLRDRAPASARAFFDADSVARAAAAPDTSRAGH